MRKSCEEVIVEFDDLAELIFNEIIPKLEGNVGISVFARERAKFEGWLKVELCESLLKHFQDVIPERNRIDITFDDRAIELKTVNTNYRYSNVENKTRPITMNIQGVIKDINKLKATNYANKAILLVVFPAKHDHKDWQIHLQKIQEHVLKIDRKEFMFRY